MVKTNYMKDAGKYPLIIVKVMLSYLCLWPLNKSFVIKIIRYFILINIILLNIFQIYYMISNITDLTVIASTCTTVSATIQQAAKSFFIHYYSDDLGEILTVMFDEFWPANITGPAAETSIKNGSRVIVIMACSYLCGAFKNCWDIVIIPMVSGRRIFPLESSFPFDSRKSPIFELLYVWQFIMCFYVIIHTLTAHDLLFTSLVTNCISQFKLLNHSLESIGTVEGKKINQRLNSFKNVAENKVTFIKHFDNIKEDEEYELVKKCVEHHYRVLIICDKLQNIFGVIILVQFFYAISALCFSSFVSTQFEDYKIQMMLFSSTVLIQLFCFCAIGNELICQSGKVANASYNSNWYNAPNLRLRKALILIIQRAQREQKMTALGFADLNYPNFVQVIRLSFSFYTLLVSIKE